MHKLQELVKSIEDNKKDFNQNNILCILRSSPANATFRISSARRCWCFETVRNCENRRKKYSPHVSVGEFSVGDPYTEISPIGGSPECI